MVASEYIDALRKSKTSNTKIILSPKRQIVEHQRRRCYMCETTLENVTCYFAVIEGPDMDTGINSKELRASCPTCYFKLGQNPVKQVKKQRDIKAEKEKEKKAEEEEQKLFRELKLKHSTKDEMYDQWR